MTITINGLPITEQVYAIAREHASKTNQPVSVGVEYFGEHGAAFLRDFPRGVHCRWLIGYTRDELIGQYMCFGIIHISPEVQP